MIVLYGITGPGDGCTLQSRDGGHQGALHINGQRRGDAIRINDGIVETFGLQEYLMAIAFSKPNDLIFDGGTITRTSTLDLARVHGRSVHIGFNNGVAGLGGSGVAAL